MPFTEIYHDRMHVTLVDLSTNEQLQIDFLVVIC